MDRSRVDWTVEIRNYMRRAIKDGASASVIAGALSTLTGQPVTRNMVINACRRFQIALRAPARVRAGQRLEARRRALAKVSKGKKGQDCQSVWTPEAISLVEQKTREGVSYSQIAALLNDRFKSNGGPLVTKGAVAGLVYRRGLTRVRGGKKIAAKADLPSVLIAGEKIAPASPQDGFIDPRGGLGCRYIYGDVLADEDWRYCGHRLAVPQASGTAPAGSYCADHLRLCVINDKALRQSAVARARAHRRRQGRRRKPFSKGE